MKKETGADEIDFEVIINKDEKEFVFTVPELNLTIRDADIKAGYDKICSEKLRLIKEYKDAQFDIPELPKKKEKQKEKVIAEESSQKMNYEGLAIKAGIVSAIFCLFFVASIYIAANIATSKIETLLFHQIPDAAPRELALQVNILAKKIQDISPEEREKFRDNMLIIMNELKPAFQIINSENSDTDSLIKP